MKKLAKTIAGNTITFTFANGDSFEANIHGLTAKMIDRLAVHGMSQKIGDACASESDPETCHAKCLAVWENLQRDVWSDRTSTGGILAEALKRVSGRDMAECITALGKLDDKQKRALRQSADIAKAIAEISAERAEGNTGMDVASLFK